MVLSLSESFLVLVLGEEHGPMDHHFKIPSEVAVAGDAVGSHLALRFGEAFVADRDLAVRDVAEGGHQVLLLVGEVHTVVPYQLFQFSLQFYHSFSKKYNSLIL